MLNEPVGTWRLTGNKICSLCKEGKEIAMFPWNKARDAPHSWCTVCTVGYREKWNSRNPDKVKSYDVRYKEGHREVLKKRAANYNKAAYEKNREKLVEKRGEYYRLNRQKCYESIRASKLKSMFAVGGIVIYRNAEYTVVRRTRGGFYIELFGPADDDYYFSIAVPSAIVTRAEVKKKKSPV